MTATRPVAATPQPPDPGRALDLIDVVVRIADRIVLDHITWTVRPGERWIVLGRNGCGKTTLLRVASLNLHPSAGIVDVLGERLGRTDVRTLRTRVAIASSSMADRFRPGITAADLVMTAKHAALETWWHTYDDSDRARARTLLDQLGIGSTANQPFATMSSGERQRALLARTMMNDPGLLLLDEPTAGLDLGGREDLIDALDALAAAPGSPPMVLVTHHVEEIPPAFTHVLLLRAGQILAAGPIGEVLDADHLSTCFETPLTLDHAHRRWAARRATA